MRKLSLQGFRQWLEDNKDNHVGIVFDHCHCPIAQYMQEVHSMRTSVDGYIIQDLDNFYVEDMELWSRRFVRWLDNEHQYHSNVTGVDALKDLDDSIKSWG